MAKPDAEDFDGGTQPAQSGSPSVGVTAETGAKRLDPAADLHVLPVQSAQSLRETLNRQTENAKAFRLEQLAAVHPEVAELLAEIEQLRAAAKKRK